MNARHWTSATLKARDISAPLGALISVAAIILVVCLLGFETDAAAQDDRRVPVDSANTVQKALVVENLVTRSVSAQAIEASGDDAAIVELARARELVAAAKAEIAVGRFAEANARLDEALWVMNQQTRDLTGRDARRDRERAIYDDRRKAVHVFLEAYRRVAGEKAPNAVHDHVANIEKLVADAESLAAANQVSDANAVLGQAYRIARGDIKAMREGETLVRSLDFATPEEEYTYERGRNESHIALLQFAITNRKPPSSRLARIEPLKEEAEALRGQALDKAQANDHVAAIGLLMRSTETLLKAIRMSGLWIPG